MNRLIVSTEHPHSRSHSVPRSGDFLKPKTARCCWDENVMRARDLQQFRYLANRRCLVPQNTDPSLTGS